MIPQSALLDPAILKEFIRNSGLSYKQTAVSYVFTCPKCNKQNKLYIRKSDGRFRCFYCYGSVGFHGRADWALSELLNVERKNVASALFGYADLPHSLYLDINIKDFLTPEDNEPLQDDLIEVSYPYDYYPIDHKHSARGAAYLEGRGVPLEIAKKYNIRYAPSLLRVIFPVEFQGSLLGWQGRLVVPTEYEDEDGEIKEALKVQNSFGLKRDRIVMFADRVTQEHLILCEGPIDAIKCDRIGGNVATMGKGVSPGQINLIKNSGIKRLYLALDPDAATETSNLVDRLSGDMVIYHMLAAKTDLGDMDFDEVYDLYRSAVPIGAGKVFIYIKPLKRSI
jgi:hypothetical protein